MYAEFFATLDFAANVHLGRWIVPTSTTANPGCRPAAVMDFTSPASSARISFAILVPSSSTADM